MKIKGIFGLTAIDPNTNKEFIQPIPNAILVFLNIKTNAAINIETNALGAYDGDLPVGEYSVRAYIKGKVQAIGYLRQGVTFNVTSTTPVGAFDEWTKIDFDATGSDPLLEEWKKVLADLDEAKIATVTEIEKATNDFKDASQGIGDIGGKNLKQGAYGIGGYRLGMVDDGVNSYTQVPKPNEIHNTGLQTLTAVGLASQATEDTHVPEINQPYGGISIPRDLRPCEFGVSARGHNARFYYRGFTNASSNTADWIRVSSEVTTPNPANFEDPSLQMCGFFSNFKGEIPEGMWEGSKAGIVIKRGKDISHFLYTGIGGNLTLSTMWNGIWRHHNVYYSNANTVVDSNGNLKIASPVIQLHHNGIVVNSDFDPLDLPYMEKKGVGEYLIKNCGKMRSDGWTFNKPMNGKGQYYFMLKWEQVNDKDVLIRIFEVEYTDNGIDFGKPKDILENERWVDLHFDDNHEYKNRLLEEERLKTIKLEEEERLKSIKEQEEYEKEVLELSK